MVARGGENNKRNGGKAAAIAAAAAQTQAEWRISSSGVWHQKP